MPDFSYNLDKCFFSKRDTSLFLEKEEVLGVSEKNELINSLAAKHKVSVVQLNASKPLDVEDMMQALYYEVEKLIGFDIEKSISKYSDVKKSFVIADLLKDIAIVVHNAKHLDLELMTELQRLSLTLKRHTHSRLRLIFIDDLGLLDHVVEGNVRMEHVKSYFTNISEKEINEVRHAMDVEIKLERRSIERFLGDYIEIVKLRPRVKSFLGNL